MQWTMTFGELAVVLSLAGSVAAYIFKSGGVHRDILYMQRELADLKVATRQITEILTKMAVQESRLTAQSERLNTLDKRIEDLRRGDGFIAGHRGVDREFGGGPG